MAAGRFLREFEEEYGTVHPQFFNGSYGQACQHAKAEFKFLVVYLHSAMHHETPSFCKDTLCTELIADFLNEHFVFWAGHINRTEGYKASIQLGASTFPFMAVLCNNSVGGITMIDRIEGVLEFYLCSQLLSGFISSEDFISRLTAVLEIHGHILTTARIEQYCLSLFALDVLQHGT